MSLPTEEQVTDKLRAVIDPELRKNIVELGMVRAIDIADDGRVGVIVSLTTPGCPIRSHFVDAVTQNVGELEGVTAVAVEFDVLSDDERANLQQSLGRNRLPAGRARPGEERDLRRLGQGRRRQVDDDRQPRRRARRRGHAAGALDCDVYGYSIPRMLGVDGRPDVNEHRKIIPLEGPAGVKVMSIGFFVEDNAAVVWRGPMLHKAIQQFLEDVDWGALDYLLLDLPPGHRRRLDDARTAPAAGEDHDRHHPAACRPVRRAPRGRDGRQGRPRGARRDREHVGLHRLPTGSASRSSARAAASYSPTSSTCPLLGKVPLSEDLRAHADAGAPLVLEEPNDPAAIAIRQTARGIVAATPQELAVLQSEPPAMAAAAPVSGTELKVIQS